MHLATLLLFCCSLLPAATYHVNSKSGDDSRSGASPSAAWKTLERVNRETFRPGDRILLRSGCAWQGFLHPKGSGAEGTPIVVDRYGQGARPRIDASGMAEDAVRLHNQAHWEIRNLEITNHGGAPAVRRGVHVSLDNFGTARHIVLAGLVIHDVNGDNKRKDNGGIIWRANGDRTPSRFDGLTIERNVIYRVDRSAIAAQSSHWDRRRWFPSLRVVIRDNFVDDIGGDGIVPWASDGALVQHNVARNCNRRADAYNAGIWPWSCDNTRLEWNEASFTRTLKDGQGFDSDFNSRNTLFQFNYSHDNEGGFMLVCTPGPGADGANLGNVGTVIRYNISRNDGARTFHFGGPTRRTRVHDNAIYIGRGLDVQMLLLTNWKGWAEEVEFRNNTIVAEGTARYGSETKRGEDGSYQIQPGFGQAQKVTFEGNKFYGRHVGRPEDARAAVEPAARTPDFAWDGPEFDPARGGDYDAFLEKHRRWMRELFEQQFGKTAPPPLEQFVRVSPRDFRYLEFTDGTPYIPIGLNMIAPPRAASEGEALRGFEEWLRQLAANGGNYIRVWLSNPFWDVEHQKSGVYDLEKATRIDRMLDLCRKYRIRVKMTMEHFRTVGEPGQSWATKPLHHVSQGGPAKSIADFFDGEPSRAGFRNKIRWYAGRYGDLPVVYGWELWNEIDAVRGGDYLAWTEAMLPELHRAFPRNLCLQSLGSFDRYNKRDRYRRHSLMAGNDTAQVHRYLDLGAEMEVCKEPVDVMAADSIRELLGYGPKRPVILAESGAVEPKHTGPFKLYAADKEGIILHDVLFAPFFAGSAGGGQIWHWDAYVAANNLWWHFGRFAEAVKGLDPPAEEFGPSMIEHERLRVYALTGRRSMLAWCRDKANSWEAELKNGAKPELLRGVEVALGRTGTAKIYDPWKNKWSQAKISGGKVRLPEFSRSIVIRVD